MSNPSIASKLMTLVKGVIGPKKPARTTSEPETAEGGSAEAEHTPMAAAGATTVAEPAETTTDNASGAEPTSGADPATAEPAAATTGGSDPADAGENLDAEDRTEIAEELAGAEAATREASDEVLDQVRKEAAPEATELPVPGYDELTLPSIRARLRKLTLEQVRELRAYEVANQGRQEFIKMYDNRITKLTSETQ